MSTVIKEGKKKSRITILDRPTAVSWLERKSLADKETETLEKQIQDLKTWVRIITFRTSFLVYFFNFQKKKKPKLFSNTRALFVRLEEITKNAYEIL